MLSGRENFYTSHAGYGSIGIADFASSANNENNVIYIYVGYIYI